MVNENLKPIENKKPFETVQELEKYEIKTSKLSPAARAKVIKKYGGNYVSENREGYGPCTPSYCDCQCPRNDCKCETGERFIKLKMPCPAVRKDENGNIVRCPGGEYSNATN